MRAIRVPERGMTLVELSVGMTMGIVGVGAVAGVLLSAQRQHDEVSVRSDVLQAAVSLLEEVKGSSPNTLVKDYDGKQYTLGDDTGSLEESNSSTSTATASTTASSTASIKASTTASVSDEGTSASANAGTSATVTSGTTSSKSNTTSSGTTADQEPVFTVDVDDSNEKLLRVTVTATWVAGGAPRSMVLQTEVYNSKGK
jgi:type II secretory pathway pseudopilin PulG